MKLWERNIVTFANGTTLIQLTTSLILKLWSSFANACNVKVQESLQNQNRANCDPILKNSVEIQQLRTMWSLFSLKCIIWVIRALENATTHVLFLGKFWVLYSFNCFVCVSGKKHVACPKGTEQIPKVTNWNKLKILIGQRYYKIIQILYMHIHMQE